MLLILSGINPVGVFGESDFITQTSSYLNEEDIAYNNLVQLIATDEGFLVKNMPQQEESVKIERIDFVDHEVQKGEDIQTIASMYDLSVDTLIWENNIISVDTVKIGDRVKIPPADGISYEVKRGDTLSVLAQKYESSIDAITKFNPDNANLRVGTTIFIPGGKRISTQLIAANTEEPNTSDQPVSKPTKVANIHTDINANIMPTYDDYEAPTKRPAVPDATPTPNIAPLQGITSSTSFVRDADPTIQAPAPTQVQAQPAPTTISSPPAGGIPDSVAPKTAGQWGKPTIGNITQGYRNGHFAIDIGNRSKPAIWATAAGVIEVAQGGGPYGNHIIINHENGYKTLYAHNSVLYVKVGDRVTQGQVIAQMGNTGRVYGPTGIHLHYECHLEGVRINPYNCME